MSAVSSAFLVISSLALTFAVYYLEFKPGPKSMPFISLTIDYQPGSCIGNVCLWLASCFMGLVVIFDQRQMSGWADALFDAQQQHPTRPSSGCTCLPSSWSPRKARIMAGIASVMGLAGAVGLNGVAGVQYHNLPIIHTIFAGVFFTCSQLHMGFRLLVEFACASSSSSRAAGSGSSSSSTSVASRILGVCLMLLSFLSTVALILFMPSQWITLSALGEVGMVLAVSTNLMRITGSLRQYMCGFFVDAVCKRDLQALDFAQDADDDLGTPTELEQME
ncbi:hypothetical protein Pelo_4575 [Pelomyxa schiedti]|nr:hypothetical protein Pelo_4575 [Pelomyxa schiedti]